MLGRSGHGGGDIGYTKGIGGYFFGYSLFTEQRGEFFLGCFTVCACCFIKLFQHFLGFSQGDEFPMLVAVKHIEGFLFSDGSVSIFVKDREDLFVAVYFSRVLFRLSSAFG